MSFTDAVRRAGWQDAGLAVLLLAASAPAFGGGRSGRAAGVTPVLDGSLAEAWPRIRLLLIGLCVAAVAVGRRWPIPALAVATVATVAQMAAAAGPVAADVAVPVLLYAVAAQRRRAVSLALLGVTLTVAVSWSAYVAFDGWRFEQAASGGQARDSEDADGPGRGGDTAGPPGQTVLGPTDWGGILVLGLLLIVAWAVGWGIRSRQAYLGELEARARDLERERDQQAALAVAAERARITRELHDVVAHGLAVIVMQAQGGAAAFAKRPADTLAALDTIVATGRASLADMRQVLSAAGQIDDGTRPVPGLAQLPRLVEQVRQAGTPVRLHIDGTPGPVPTSVDVSAYRIVQEALTNTMKHGGAGACAQVVVAYRSGELEIDASDNGIGDRAAEGTGTGHRGSGLHGGGLRGNGQQGGALRGNSPHGDGLQGNGPHGDGLQGNGPHGDGLHGSGIRGNGLRGMRERVALLGGEVDAGPGPEGGYVVRARIPLDRAEEAT
ncbi:sensor histidine kinase [Actinoplanes sp. L3-i22]|uniref:sensor histidine kinase n=1 Tax=Actinoplanes sp. L3-i22 TaxID=2836373 RepID=UPI001C78BBF1|nr:histidine kinase [Actinoplanes sp. L3-i22]BCY08500.1 hypothetical protein L3i22_035880 [Actinoplanes sp. L3-i22]